MKINENILDKYSLSEYELELTSRCFMPERIQAGAYFLKQGEVSGQIAFVKDGLLRSFVYDENTKEITTQFYPSGSLVISFESFNNQVPANENIVAIDTSELFIVTFQKLTKLYLTAPAWVEICKEVADANGIEAMARLLQFQTQTATERYQQFCRDYPQVIKRAAIGHIASYLGIDIATLSRIRKKTLIL
jgi:CRP-like cAMP-binding protein